MNSKFRMQESSITKNRLRSFATIHLKISKKFCDTLPPHAVRLCGVQWKTDAPVTLLTYHSAIRIEEEDEH
jgi:hypothetical protein